MNKCKDCEKLFVGGIFCYSCGSSNIEPIGDDFPF